MKTGTMKRINLITLDCWDTTLKTDLVYDLQIKNFLIDYICNNWNLNCQIVADFVNKEEVHFFELVYKQQITLSSKERIIFLLNELSINPDINELIEIDNQIQSMIFSPIPELVQEIEILLKLASKNCHLGLICNTGWFSGKSIRSVFAYYKLNDYFEIFTFSDELGFAKPKPEIFQYVLNKFSLSPNEMLHIGNNISTDFIGADNLKIDFIFFSGISTNETNILGFSSFLEMAEFINETYILNK